jgi:hypothetical protein
MLIVIRLVLGVEMTCSIAGRIACATSLGRASSANWMNSRAASDWPIWAASVVRKIRKGNSENRLMKAMWPAKVMPPSSTRCTIARQVILTAK